ncbi:MerR family transcriptional regulator [Cohnella thermotolerans]|uniref:MerR family transcriptional regulator n=1 Tax=Cohnella thermotolerans TaxID=329858 RepID=UPI000411A295|nr:MerR family transcriptional regulator [Cohnella thermotolerans]
MSFGTKEAADHLGVSQTTLKRWVSYFPELFPKDRLGHYMFSEQEMEWLQSIKAEVRSGVPLESVRPPGRRSQPAGSNRDSESIMLRLHQLERMMERKADEVVSAQVLQHRREIDELRQMIQQIADSLEKMRQAAASRDIEPSPRPASPPPFVSENRTARKPRKKIFRLF